MTPNLPVNPGQTMKPLGMTQETDWLPQCQAMCKSHEHNKSVICMYIFYSSFMFTLVVVVDMNADVLICVLLKVCLQ